MTQTHGANGSPPLSLLCLFPRNRIIPLSCALSLGIKAYTACSYSWGKPRDSVQWAPSRIFLWVFRVISVREQMELEGAWFAFPPFLLWPDITMQLLRTSRWSFNDCFGLWGSPEMAVGRWKGLESLMTCRSHLSPGPPLPGLISYEKMSVILKLGFSFPVIWC